MTSNVADTSKKHYEDMQKSGEIGDQAHKVKKALEKLDGNPTINELGHTIELSGMDNSTISGRLNDLKDAGVVQDLSGDAKREDKFSGITCKVWSLVDDSSTAVVNNGDVGENAEEEKPSSVEPSKDEWVSLSENVESDEEEPDLFVEKPENFKQEEGNLEDDVKKGLEPGDVIYG